MCDGCGEEVINEREIIRDGLVLCRTCAGESYYRCD
jgi:formylmethanofuran dehydrogenase subunit E